MEDPVLAVKLDFIWHLLDEFMGFFSLLLMGAGLLCFVSYGMVPDDQNLALGLVLVTVVCVTSVYAFIQNRKSDNMMAEFPVDQVRGSGHPSAEPEQRPAPPEAPARTWRPRTWPWFAAE